MSMKYIRISLKINPKRIINIEQYKVDLYHEYTMLTNVSSSYYIKNEYPLNITTLNDYDYFVIPDIIVFTGNLVGLNVDDLYLIIEETNFSTIENLGLIRNMVRRMNAKSLYDLRDVNLLYGRIVNKDTALQISENYMPIVNYIGHHTAKELISLGLALDKEINRNAYAYLGWIYRFIN